MDMFNKLEKLVRQQFETNLDNLEATKLNRLYFIYGGKIGTYFDYRTDTIRLTEMKFKYDEKFKDLTIIQLIRTNKMLRFISCFEKEVKSIQRETTVFDMQDSVIKLINMRNILSHELNECEFKDKDIIELLSDEKIESLAFDFLVGYDYMLMDNPSKCIISNYIYMSKIIEMIVEG